MTALRNVPTKFRKAFYRFVDVQSAQ